MVLVALLGVILNTSLMPADLDAWGWRIPFLSAASSSLLSSRSADRSRDRWVSRPQAPPDDHRDLARSCATGGSCCSALIVTMSTVSFYFITATPRRFGREVFKLPGSVNLVVTLCVRLSNLWWIPVMGALSTGSAGGPTAAVRRADAFDGLSGADVDGRCAVVHPAPGRRAMAVVPVRQLWQWCHGRVHDRNHADRGPHRQTPWLTAWRRRCLAGLPQRSVTFLIHLTKNPAVPGFGCRWRRRVRSGGAAQNRPGAGPVGAGRSAARRLGWRSGHAREPGPPQPTALRSPDGLTSSGWRSRLLSAVVAWPATATHDPLAYRRRERSNRRELPDLPAFPPPTNHLPRPAALGRRRASCGLPGCRPARSSASAGAGN